MFNLPLGKQIDGDYGMKKWILLITSQTVVMGTALYGCFVMPNQVLASVIVIPCMVGILMMAMDGIGGVE